MLAPWKKSYDQSRQPIKKQGKKDIKKIKIKKQRHYFTNKGPSNQSYGFPVVMYGCEIWTVKKAERRRIDAFELWCWRRLLRVPWTARRSNQSILKEISPDAAETSTVETKHTLGELELRFITPAGPEELTLQALNPGQRDYRVLIL